VHDSAVAGDQPYGRDPEVRLSLVLSAWEALGEELDLVLMTGDQTEDGPLGGLTSGSVCGGKVGGTRHGCERER